MLQGGSASSTQPITCNAGASNPVNSAVSVFVEGPAGRETQWNAIPVLQVDDGRVSISASGLLLSSTILLTSMEVFYPFLKGVHQSCVALHDPELVPTTAIFVYSDTWIQASLCFGIRLQLCDNAFSPLKARGWTCGYRGDSVLGAFGVAILRLESPMSPVDSPLHDVDPIEVGDDIQLIASPFGVMHPSVFTRTMTKGCIASVDHLRSLYLLDARTYCGSEGGVIVAQRRHVIIGMCAPPLLQNGNTSAFSLGIPLHVIVNECAGLNAALRPSVFSLLGSTSLDSPSRTCSAPKALNVSDTSVGASIVMLLFGGSWASGVAITPKIIITCAHFITGSSDWMSRPSNSVKFLGAKCTVKMAGADLSFDARVVLVFDGFLDVALLEVDEPVLKPLRWCVPTSCRKQLDALPNTGQVSLRDDVFAESAAVKVIGFPLFGQDHPWETPIETHGVITKTLTNTDHRPVMIQSSAPVYSGSSGGALLTPNNELIGLVTTNVRIAQGVLPCVNFSLPSNELLPALEAGSVPYDALQKRWKERDLGEKERNLWLLKAEPLQLPTFISERKKRGDALLRSMPPKARL